MADYTQADHTFIAHAHYVNATNWTVVGTADDVRSYLSAVIYIDHAPIEDATANDPGIIYEIQVNHDDAAGDEYWRTILTVAASPTASTMETLDGAAASGQKVVPTLATGDAAIGDVVYILDNDGAAGSEWAQVASIIAATSLTMVDNLTNAFVTTDDDVMILGVERWVLGIELDGIAHLRVVCFNGDDTGHDWACAAYAKYATDIE